MSRLQAHMSARLAGVLLGIALPLAASVPGYAQQPSRGLDLSLPPAAVPPPDVQSPATMVSPTKPFKPDPDNCKTPQNCGPQLLGGNARRRGMFELQVPAWRW
jgi:hypothetical protein